MPFTFDIKYLWPAAALLIAEICIALFVKDEVVRPFAGDVLVVALLYCFFRIFLRAPYRKVAAGVFLFACLVEVLQYFDYVALLRLENNRALSVMMGRTFEWLDFLAYLTGFLLILAAEKFVRAGNVNENL